MSLLGPAQKSWLAQSIRSRKCFAYSCSGARYASSSKAKGNSSAGESSSSPGSSQKARSLGAIPEFGPMSNQDVIEAERSFLLRKMPYDEAEFKRLQDARARGVQSRTERSELLRKRDELRKQIESLMSKSKHSGPRPAEVMTTTASSSHKDASSSDTPDVDTANVSSATGERDGESSTPGASSNLEHASQQELDLNISQAREVREKLAANGSAWGKEVARTNAFRNTWPNTCHAEVPVGAEENAIVLSMHDPLGTLPADFTAIKKHLSSSTLILQIKDFPAGPGSDPARDHLAVTGSIDHAEVDMNSGTLATGGSWPYLLGTLSLLEHALSQYALSAAVQRDFLPVSPPDVVRMDLADRCGFRPRDLNAKQTYKLNSTKADIQELVLAATAEIPLAGLLASRQFSPGHLTRKRKASLIERSELPIKLVAMGHAFRAEAGARGSDTRGLYRVHQFTKVEMFVATEPDSVKSDHMLESLREIQESIVRGLGLAYRVLDMPTEELGASAYRKYDIEVWMPGRGSWGEVSSASNCTDYQASRLGITIQNDRNKQSTVHTLNATAAAIPRLIVSILETHGIQDGKLRLPDTLLPFWLKGADDPNVLWFSTGQAASNILDGQKGLSATSERQTSTWSTASSGLTSSSSKSHLQTALQQVRDIALRNGTSPSMMAASFLILHELTAIVPLFVMFYVFGALGVGTVIAQWLLGDHTKTSDNDAVRRFQLWARLKEERFERWARRKGYLGFEKQAANEQPQELGQSTNIAGTFANALASFILVKALLPVRIGVSIALAGRFSRTVLEPVKRAAKRLFARATTP